jgi:23S rRNA pseudouridine1911/1915/1917 synthase
VLGSFFGEIAGPFRGQASGAGPIPREGEQSIVDNECVALNDGFEYRERLGPEAEGERLLAYLARRYRHSSTSAWRERIESGRVLVDATPASAAAVLRRGQTLIWRRPPWDEPSAPASFAVLYEDDPLLAVAKPAGLPTLPGGGFLQTTLLHRVRAYAPGASPLHRLGRWTSGLVLFAKTRTARAELVRQWAAGGIRKRYRALAGGEPARREFSVDARIGPVPHPVLGTVHAATPEGRPAESRVVVLERRARGFLCDVFIATGRPHQIRIHLAAAGHPLAGDPLYGPGGVPAPGCRAVPGDPGYRLHAAELGFRHPRTGAKVAIECAPPPLLRRG